MTAEYRPRARVGFCHDTTIFPVLGSRSEPDSSPPHGAQWTLRSSVSAEPDVSVSVHVPSQAGQPALESSGRRLAGLFPSAVYTRLTPARTVVAIVAVIVGAVVCLLRVTGTGPLQSIWEEDARDILDGALNTDGWGPLWRPVAGYFVLGPRLLGELTTVFPLSWAAGVLSISAAIITGLLALQVYCASEPFFPNPVA